MKKFYKKEVSSVSVHDMPRVACFSHKTERTATTGSNSMSFVRREPVLPWFQDIITVNLVNIKTHTQTQCQFDSLIMRLMTKIDKIHSNNLWNLA